MAEGQMHIGGELSVVFCLCLLLLLSLSLSLFLSLCLTALPSAASSAGLRLGEEWSMVLCLSLAMVTSLECNWLELHRVGPAPCVSLSLSLSLSPSPSLSFSLSLKQDMSRGALSDVSFYLSFRSLFLFFPSLPPSWCFACIWMIMGHIVPRTGDWLNGLTAKICGRHSEIFFVHACL